MQEKATADHFICPRRENRRFIFNAKALEALCVDPALACERGY